MLRKGHVRIKPHRRHRPGPRVPTPPSLPNHRGRPAIHYHRTSRPPHPPPIPEHLVTHLIVHYQIWNTYSERIWPPLRALYDLLCLTRHHTIDWSLTESLFRNAGQLTTLKLHLLQFQQDFGVPPPIPITLTPFEKLRWSRRRLLNRWPSLRFFDPTYLFLIAFRRRFRIFRAVVSAPGGLSSTLQTILTPAFYRRILDDLWN